MGIVKRQSVKFSIVSYAALLLGTINVLFIYPFAFDPEELGLIRFILEAALMIVPFISLGFGNVIIKYFPHFKNDSKTNNGFLFFVYVIPIFAFIIFVLFLLLFKEDIYHYYSEKNSLFEKFLIFVVPLSGLILLSYLSQSYCYNFQRIVVPNILNNLLIKITLPVLALLYYYQVIMLNQLMNGVVLTYVIILIGFLVYIHSLGHFSLKPQLSFLDKFKIKEIANYSFYGILSGIGSVVALRIDTFMIASMVDLTNTGIYTIAVFIAGVIAVPYKAVVNIGTSIIAKAWAENDIDTINMIYKKSSLILLILGMFIFLFIWLSIDDFFAIMPNGEKYISGKNVVLILGIAKLIDVSASMNDNIINYSKYYRFNFYAIIILAILNLTNNLLLIPEYKIVGAAFATLISITIFNIIKMVYIKRKVGILPFTIKTIYVLAIGMCSIIIFQFIPKTEYAILNVIINGAFLSLVFLGPILYFKLSEDLNDVTEKLINRFRGLI